ncbi:MAG: S8 family peptidase [Bacteroidetes bacterium]|nr:S8 family peptidase [Bacteroidota bacterium]
MAKILPLLLFVLGSTFFSNAQVGFKLVNIQPTQFKDSTSKTNPSAFRYQQKDYIVVEMKNNSATLVENNGLSIVQYLGNSFYLVSSPTSETSRNVSSKDIINIGYVEPDSKIDLALNSIKAVAQIEVSYASSIEEQTLKYETEKIGISILKNNSKSNRFTTTANPKQIQALAKLPFVYFISKNYEHKNALIYESMLMLGVKQVNNDKPYHLNLKGEGINVGIWDEGVVGKNYDLPVNKNHVVDKENNSDILMRHPTYVAGFIAGQGNNFTTLQGVAPASDVYYWDVLNDIVNEIKTGKEQFGVDISNHSYNFAETNCVQSGFYLPETGDLDKLVYENPTLLPIVAVGNSASICTVTDTFSSVDIGFQGCKNAITVGWLFGNEQIVGNSGRGPTVDGRLKPELVAKGFGVSVTAPNNSYTTGWGSSFAAPQIAGVATLLYQQFKQQYGTLPNAALIKAILCNTARDLGNVGPDYTYGFGKPDALSAVNTIKENRFAEGDCSQGQVKTHIISMPSGLQQLNVALCWTDKESTPLATNNIVNDLDIKVVTPSGDTVLPWKLSPQYYKLIATKGVDNLNTIEQVTVSSPMPGNYTIVVKGTNVPFDPQNYAITYNPQPKKIELTHPNGGEVIDAQSTMYVKWYNNGIDSLASVQLSLDSGATWQTIAFNIQLKDKKLDYILPNVVSNKCLLRIVSGNNIATSAATFTIGAQVNYSTIQHVACDKSIRISWSPYVGGTAYKVYLFIDSAWVNVGQTDTTFFDVENLINGKEYLYAISTIVNDVEGNHSLAKTCVPNPSSACATQNDVGVYAVYKPSIGRKWTSNALTATEKLSFVIKNYGQNNQTSIPISYQINGSSISNATLSSTLNSNDSTIFYFTTNENLSAVGNYDVIAWTNLVNDENKLNDTLKFTIRHLPNAPISLPFSESFEETNTQYSTTYFGIDGLEYADYYPEDGMRLRTNEGTLYSKTGNHAITLDNYLQAASHKNELVFTYNLSNYVDSVVLFDFNYMDRAEADSNDVIYARGNDTQTWVPIFDLYANKGVTGKYKSVSEINLYQNLKVENGQDFSSSTQLKIVQNGLKSAISPNGNGGYSFDDFVLYNAGKDVAVVTASTKKIQCSKTFANQQISITVKNNSGHNIANLPVHYQINNEPIVNATIPSIPINDTLTYTFSNPFTNHPAGKYNIKTWASNSGDLFHANDSFNLATILVLPTIDSFPYYNDFENDNGNLLTEGENNSWIWTTPQKFNIDNAAQGNKAWTTGQHSGYNFKENSYLYLGCMDFSTASTDPLLSFNFLSDMQSASDSAYAEYSTDGENWRRLGCYDCSLNWYNGYLNNPYWDQTIYPWQVAHTIIPLSDIPSDSNFICRIHLLSDDFYTSEGIGIDDIHILTDFKEIAPSDSGYITAVSSGNGWIPFYRNGKIVAELFDDYKNLGIVHLGFESNLNKQKVYQAKNVLPRNWVILPEHPQLGNFKLKLYVLNNEYTQFVLAEDSINRMGDIGLLRYIGLNTDLDVNNNYVNAYYRYFSPEEIQFYPYLNGYYIALESDTLGEFYLISTHSDANAIGSANLIDFAAHKVNDDVYLEWKTTIEKNSKEFVIQYSFDAQTFINVDTVPAGINSTTTTAYNYLHELNANAGIYYYRIMIVDNANKKSYSLIDSVYFAPTVGIKQQSINVSAFIASDDIVLDWKNKVTTPAIIRIYDVLGQLQWNKNVVLQNGRQSLGIENFNRWSNGALFMQIQTENQNYYIKLIKQ